MELSTAQQILVIVLATALGIFLILAIASAIMVVTLLKRLRDIANKAERLMESAEAVGDMLKKAAGPMTILSFGRSIFDMVAQHKRDKNKET